jgi:hypothetical protein
LVGALAEQAGAEDPVRVLGGKDRLLDRVAEVASKPGTDVMDLIVFSPKQSAQKIGVFDS